MADVNTNPRPNIRIEIKNNVNENMEIDEESINISEGEEGEIIDKNGEEEEEEDCAPQIEFAKSRDIWAKFDDRSTTANTNDQVKNQIESVYTSLNVKELRNKVRLDAVHMHQSGRLNTLDILKYFLAYSPTAIEWIDEKSCNILWADMPMAARALYNLSKAIVGSKDDGSLEETMDLDGQNNGMQNKNRIIEIKDDDKDIDKEPDKENTKEIHIRDIKEDIPEGTWRLGRETVKCKFILLRFALASDKPTRAEHFTEYYKQCGVIENGKALGIISKSRKRKFQGIFDRNRELSSGEPEITKNPWGTLAESWYQDYARAESEYAPPTILTSKRLETVSNLQHRLGFKRAHLNTTENDENLDETDAPYTIDDEVITVQSDLEDTIASAEHTSRQLLEKRLKHKSSKKKKSKVPRMRMYADEEEAKIKRKKSLQSLKKKLSQKKKLVEEEEIGDAGDLRYMLGKRVILKPKRRLEDVLLVVKQEGEENGGRQMEDLGNKLRHRHLMRLSEAAAKNSAHLHSQDDNIHRRISTCYHEEEFYDLPAPKIEPPAHRQPRSTITYQESRSTLHSDSILPQQQQHRGLNTRRSHQHHSRKDLRSDREGRDHYERDGNGRHRDREQRGSKHDRLSHGRMHSDREEYYSRRMDSESSRRKYRRDMDDEEMERVERKGAKSKVMIVVKKQHQPTVASMAILPPPSNNHQQPLSLSTSNLRHRRHDNARLATRADSSSSSSSSSSSNSSEDEDSSSSSSSSSSEDDDDEDGSSSESGSESDSDSDSESSESEESKRGGGTTVVRGGRGSIKDRVGTLAERGEQQQQQSARLRVQIKNEHYGN